MAEAVEGIDMDHVLTALGRRISPALRAWIERTLPMAKSHLRMVRTFLDDDPDAETEWDILFDAVYKGALASRVYGAGPEGDGRAIPSAIIQACKAVLLPTLIDEDVDDARSDEGIDSVEAVDMVIDDRVADAIIALEARRLAVEGEEPSPIDSIRAMAKVMRTIISFRLSTTIPDGRLASMIDAMSWISLGMATAPSDPEWLEDRANSIAGALGLSLADEESRSEHAQPDGDRTDRLHARMAAMLAKSRPNTEEDAEAAATMGIDVLRMATMGTVLGMPHLGNLPAVMKAEARWLKERSPESDGAAETALAGAIVPYAIAALAIVDRIEPASLTPEAVGNIVEDVGLQLFLSFEELLDSDQPLLAACAIIEETIIDHLEGDDEDGFNVEEEISNLDLAKNDVDRWATSASAETMIEAVSEAEDVPADEMPHEYDEINPVGWIVIHDDQPKTIRRLSSAFDALGASASERKSIPSGSQWSAYDGERSFSRMRSDARRLAKASGGTAMAILDNDSSVLAVVEGSGLSRVIITDHFI